MHYKCCVLGCIASKIKPRTGFKIPAHPSKRAAWLKKIPNSPTSNYVCSKHFEQKYIQNTSSNPRKPARTRLAKDAIPTIFQENMPKLTKIVLDKPQKRHEFVNTNTSSTIENNSMVVSEIVETEFIDINPKNTPDIDIVLNDSIGTFENLQQNIQSRLYLKNFQVQIKQTEIFLFDLNETDIKCLTIRTSVIITKSLNVFVYLNGCKQIAENLAGIFGTNFQLVLYSQLQRLINKYSDYESVPSKLLKHNLEIVTEPSKKIPSQKNCPGLNDRKLEMIRRNAAASLIELNDNLSETYRIDLNFIIQQLSLVRRKSNLKQHMFPIETIIHAYLFYCHMGDAYDAIRTQNILTIPLPSTMQLLTVLDSKPPTNLIESKYLKNGIDKMLPCEKLVNLQIKEIWFNGRITVQASNAHCHANSILCFIMNSIFGKMKKIVFLQPVNGIIGSELYDVTIAVIERIQKLNLKVISITAEQNVVTSKMFEIMTETSFITSAAAASSSDDDINNYRFTNPMYLMEFIYLLYNPATILQNIRNDWIDQTDQHKVLKYPNFDTGDIKTATFSHILELYESEIDMVRQTATKITRECVYPNANDRELFEYTLPLFDMTTIVALRAASDGYHDTVDLLNLLNMWWTIMNINTKTSAISSMNDDNILLLKSLTKWLQKWKTIIVDDNNGNVGRLKMETYDALIQTSTVMIALIKYTFEEAKFSLGFCTSQFHTEDMELLFSKYKKNRSNFA